MSAPELDLRDACLAVARELFVTDCMHERYTSPKARAEHARWLGHHWDTHPALRAGGYLERALALVQVVVPPIARQAWTFGHETPREQSVVTDGWGVDAVHSIVNGPPADNPWE